MDVNWRKHMYLDASALVKLVIDEGDHEPLRDFFLNRTNFGSTTLCIVEALGVVKAKWIHKRINEDQYFEASRKLVLGAWGKKIEVEDIGLFHPQGLDAVEGLARKHKLDLSDALQLATILKGKYAHLGPNSASILITADFGLAKAALAEGIRVWNCAKEPLPTWL